MFPPIDERQSLRFRRQNVLSDDIIKRLDLFGTLEGHEGCVNSIEWNYSGTKLCSVSDDCNIILWDPFKLKKLTQFHSNHTGNIFAVKFLEYNRENLLVTAAADSKVILHDLVTHEHLQICSCHQKRVTKLATRNHESSLFWSAGEDGFVLQTDIRTKHVCHQDKSKNVLIDLNIHAGPDARISSISTNPMRDEYIAVGANDQFIRLYDRRMIKTMEITNTIDNIPDDCVKYFTIGNPTIKRRFYHSLSCTHLVFSQTGDELLANISRDYIYLFNILRPTKPKIFTTDLVNLFGPLNVDDEGLDSIDDFNSSSHSEKMTTVDSHVSKKVNKTSPIVTPSSSSLTSSLKGKHSKSSRKIGSKSQSKARSNDSSKSRDNNVDKNLPSTSNATICEASNSSSETEDTELDEQTTLERESRKLIKRINEEKNPNLIKYEAKVKAPKFVLPLFKNAESLFKKNKYSEAIHLMNEAINIMPNVSSFYCLRANAYYARKWMRDLHCALKDFHRSLEIDPNNKESHLKMAQTLYELNHLNSSSQCLAYFRQKQSRGTRYKEFRELEQKIKAVLRRDKEQDKKKSDTIISQGFRQFYEHFGRSRFFPLSRNPSNNIDHDQTTSSSSLSSLNMSSSSSTGLSSFLDIEHTLNDNEGRHNATDQMPRDARRFYAGYPSSDSSDNESDIFNISYDSNSHSVKHPKCMREWQWRAEAYDFSQRFCGHCNISTDIMEANFFGSDGQYIVSGSDDGNFYVWDRKTGNIVNIVKADECIVNCVQPHHSSAFLATSGIDSNIKLWSPTMNEESVKEQETSRKSLIRQKLEENQKKKSAYNGIGIFFLRIRNHGDSADSEEDDDNSRQVTQNIQECFPS